MILEGNIEETIMDLPDKSVHCIVTSPPYFRQRNYHFEDQIGMESSPEEYIKRLATLSLQFYRVLRDDGCMWWVHGDNYAGGSQIVPPGEKRITEPFGLPKKNMLFFPERMMMALQDVGWIVRQRGIWHKPNVFPDSAKDRLTIDYEPFFLLSKQPKYYFDPDAIAVPAKFTKGLMPPIGGKKHQKIGGERYKGNRVMARPTRRLRSVVSIPVAQYKEMHSAGFPEDLARIFILSGSSHMGVCPACAAPYMRIVEQSHVVTRSGRKRDQPKEHRKDHPRGHRHSSAVVIRRTKGWAPMCHCDAGEPMPATIFDPFLGRGTTALVAKGHGRSWIGGEGSPEYIDMVKKNLAGVEIVEEDTALRPQVQQLSFT
ncbi:MAG: site-specific DNA-methyltransferase [Candidatus Marinimicrobia bacterium]|nr:site-specific DNA-methyltransferase [Candidatus Neomarinimicrobiota bacterium]